MTREFVECAFSEFTVSDKKMAAVIILVALTAKMKKVEVVYLGVGESLF